MKRDFTLLQLFSLFDGRLSTKIDDVYDILNHITGENLLTHHLPVIFKYLKEKNPDWFQAGVVQLSIIKASIGSDFDSIMQYLAIPENNPNISVPRFNEADRNECLNYLMENSLLLRKANP